MACRPPNTALGRWPLLFPIVVTCATVSDAELVNQLNDDFIADLDKKSPEDVWRAFCASHNLETMLSHVPKFYVCRIGKETGIWIGFHWYVYSETEFTLSANLG